MVNHGLSTGALFLLVGVDLRAPPHPADRRLRRHRGGRAGLHRGLPARHAVVDRPARSERLRRRVPDPGRRLDRLSGRPWSSPGSASSSARSTCCGCSSGCSGIRWSTTRTASLTDINARELLAVAPLLVLIVWIGVHPTTFLSPMEAAVRVAAGLSEEDALCSPQRSPT